MKGKRISMLKALVIQPVIQSAREKHTSEDANYLLQEAMNLTKALDDIKIQEGQIVKLNTVTPATLFGSGKVSELKALIEEQEIDVLVVNEDLTPAQQSNLERELNVKAVDRKGIIIAIFAKRAKTKEGKLQAQLASLFYQKTRIVKAWSHLERQRGGGGFIGGPGEKQKEIDRRLIEESIAKVKLALEKVKKTRDLQRNNRKKTPYKTISLVGYTNAGKSTLFNTITNEDIFAKDLLFATLDPTTRSIKMPFGQSAVIVDTVGFISNLPHELIMSFRSTLEEVELSDLILHVIDCSNANYIKQIEDVKTVLQEIGLKDYDQRVIEVYNKIDLLDQSQLELIEMRLKNSNQKHVFCSAFKNIGIEGVRQKIVDVFEKDSVYIKITCNAYESKAIEQIYKNIHVIEIENQEQELMVIKARATSKKLMLLKSSLPSLKIEQIGKLN